MKKQILTIIAVLTSVVFTTDAQTKVSGKSNGEESSSIKIVKKINLDDLKVYNTVASLYDNNQNAFFNLEEKQVEAFRNSSSQIISELETSRKSKKRALAQSLNAKKAIFEVIWMSKISANDDIEIIEIPEVEEAYTSL